MMSVIVCIIIRRCKGPFLSKQPVTVRTEWNWHQELESCNARLLTPLGFAACSAASCPRGRGSEDAAMIVLWRLPCFLKEQGSGPAHCHLTGKCGSASMAKRWNMHALFIYICPVICHPATCTGTALLWPLHHNFMSPQSQRPWHGRIPCA